MTVFNSFDEISIKEGVCLALGNFDGIHTGHMQILSKCVEFSKEEGLCSAVFTFNELTYNAVNGGNSVKRILSLAEKKRILEEIGIDYLISVPFDENIMKKSPEEFLELLESSMDLRHALCGFNFRFGYKAGGNADTLIEESVRKGFDMDVFPEYSLDKTTVSSTLLRKLVQESDFDSFKKYAGRPYYLSSDVLTLESSEKNSADLRIDSSQEVPQEGLYPVQIVSGEYKDSAMAMITHTENGAILSVRSRDPYVITILLDYAEKQSFRIEFE